ncbi:dsDNA nuclease domain-containing protein [Cupriavidus necator]|uniref:dsDNA nuclease domain-containing protein n=1 Tax=Cupriavidus necator TaxID=106590 RepID=UPI0009945E61|nr:dsDNA nuclease domain-containing protein [Cupriavidus necator]
MKSIDIEAPAEDVGRDTVSRFDMQYQAAAYAALQILEGKEVDCVYCDYHDDFVVRRTVDGIATYHFFQVKTKKKLNHQWGLNEIFSVKKRGQKNDADSLKSVRASFAGKLLLHAIVFDEACSEATLLSNVHFDDDVVKAVEEMRCGLPACAASKFLSENFSMIFTLSVEDSEKAAKFMSKLSLRPAVSYIGEEREAFAGAARTAIHKYSEIDLDYYETNRIANGLVDLVYRRSRTPLNGVAPETIASRVGIRLEDLLEILSISHGAYETLQQGVEDKVLKQASAIQRWLKQAGARDDMIEFASLQKVNWDIWLRSARHTYSPMDLSALLDLIDKVYTRWAQSGEGFQFLNSLLESLSKESVVRSFQGLDRELLFGAVSAVVVRKASR